MEKEKVVDKYGFLPKSVWHLKKDKELDRLVLDVGREDIQYRRKEGGVFDGKGVRYSYFNPVLARRVLLYWSDKEDIVLDPFAGRTTRGAMALEMERRYIGYEIAPKTYKITKDYLLKRNKSLFSPKKDSFELFLADGCELGYTEDNSVDLIFTCPPYWDLEEYESTEGQLSDCPTYEDFLERMQDCFKNCFRVLKEGRFAIFVVNDFRRDWEFYLMHKDFIDGMEREGFSVWDIVINQLNSPFLYAKIGQCDEAGYTFKSHEYVLVFKKERYDQQRG